MGSMKINYNATAMVSNNSINRNDNSLSESTKRLSSGLKINNAKDNPSGLAMAKRMNLQLEGLRVGKDNSNEGISIVRTADGALSEITEMLQRMNELAIKGANGTMSDSDRKTLQDEVKQLQEEISRIGSETQFNGQSILDGTFDLKGYSADEKVKVLSYSDDVLAGTYDITKLKVTMVDGQISKVEPEDMVVDVNRKLKGGTADDTLQMKVTSYKGDTLTLQGDGGYEIQLKLSGDLDTTANALSLELTGIGAMRMQVGANEGQIMELRIPNVSLSHLQIDKLDYTSKEGCLSAIDSISGAIDYISSVRSRLGAYENRLEHKISSLDTTHENMTAAYSTIMDVDMAEEMTNYTTKQVLAQSGMAMLAQANERPSQVLQLLQ